MAEKYIVLDHRVSTEFFRRLFSLERAPRFAVDLPANALFAYSEEDAWTMAPAWITPRFMDGNLDKLGILVFDAALRRRSASHVAHSWTGPVPRNSFNGIGNVFLCTPEFCYLQAAVDLSFIELIAFGCELCGLYSFDEHAERGVRQRKAPLTSRSRLASYLDGAQGCRGYKKARKALQYVVDGSASPMETYDLMCLCLPYRHGGYGLEYPEINGEVKLDGPAMRIAGLESARGDMLWRDAKFDLEHQGAYDHESTEKYYRDRARKNGLREMGIEVYELTARQVGDIGAFELVALRIAGMQGKRIPKAKLGPTEERVALRRILNEWKSSYGKLR